MAEARERSEWNRTAFILAMVANANRDPKRQKPLAPDDFNPYARQRKKKQRAEVPLTVLRDIWCKDNKGGK